MCLVGFNWSSIILSVDACFLYSLIMQECPGGSCPQLSDHQIRRHLADPMVRIFVLLQRNRPFLFFLKNQVVS